MADSLKSEILDALYSVGTSEIKDKFELLIKQYGFLTQDLILNT